MKARPKILLVDDAQVMIILIKYHLENAGYELYTAENGVEALRICEEITPDLIISDVMMPLMDGLEFRQRVMQDERLKNIPFIFLSAKAQIEDKINGLNLGVAAYITKPFDPQKLVEDVRTILKGKQAQMESQPQLAGS